MDTEGRQWFLHYQEAVVDQWKSSKLKIFFNFQSLSIMVVIFGAIRSTLFCQNVSSFVVFLDTPAAWKREVCYMANHNNNNPQQQQHSYQPQQHHLPPTTPPTKTTCSFTQERTEIYFLGIFCIEAMFKVVALGFVLHRGAYLRNAWNMMDFIVVVTGFVTSLFDPDCLSGGWVLVDRGFGW